MPLQRVSSATESITGLGGRFLSLGTFWPISRCYPKPHCNRAVAYTRLKPPSQSAMANSRFAYVRSFELPDPLLPNTYIVLRIDGHAFHKFSDAHGFQKPNDERALCLMDKAAQTLMEEYPDIILAFGESDEFSFLFKKSCQLYNRRQSKIVSMLTSLFTSAYVLHWKTFFPDTTLTYPPSFDGRVVLYPGKQEVRDYFAWRQADTHINNLYNTTFWALVQQGGMTAREAETRLKGTLSKGKHEILFQDFGVNYNALPERFKKGSVLVREVVQVTNPIHDAAIGVQDTSPQGQPGAEAETAAQDPTATAATLKRSSRKKQRPPPTIVRIMHVDIIKDDFWASRPYMFE
ncbi:tRNA-His guanylyltransferase [Ceratobasidium sp. UAMH 11750]|nr:tRNA-His guanylyltransferase [Ceratobasidium sp. UAMH 11750]